MRGETDDRMDLGRLADVACWSGEHLVRAWNSVFDQPPLATARRIQLDFAALALRQGQSVSHVAANSGYASGQAFAHAFHRQFSMCASVFQRTQPRPIPPLRIVRLDEPLICLSVPYSGIARDGFQTFDGMLERLVRAGSHRAEWDVFSVREGDGEDTIDLDKPIALHAAVLASPLRSPVRGLDGLEIKAGTYAVFDRPFGSLDVDPDSILEQHGWRRADAPRFHQFITDPARTIPSQRRDRRWVPVVPVR